MAEEEDKPKEEGQGKTKPIVCGLVMPISPVDGYPASHWSDVRTILDRIIRDAGFEPRLVSDGEPIEVIHKRIVQNLYQDELVVCDLSSLNPNVMIELGLRLAFDKPTVLVKDHLTRAPFDVNLIEYIEYPADLRYTAIDGIFRPKLLQKLEKTHAAMADPNYSPFIGHLGPFRTARVETTEVPAEQYILEELRSLRSDLVALRNPVEKPKRLTVFDRAFLWTVVFPAKPLPDLARATLEETVALHFPQVTKPSFENKPNGVEFKCVVSCSEDEEDVLLKRLHHAIYDRLFIEGWMTS